MIWAKSILAGVAALVLSAILYFLLYSSYIASTTLPATTEGNGVVVANLNLLFKTSLAPWVVVLAAFVLGFYWEFRRASR